MTESETRSIVASDGVQLHFRHWHCNQRPYGVVVCLHGIQSHSGWYEYSSRRMADAGFEVYFADRRGAGLNNQQRGHADHGVRLLNDVAQLVSLAKREHSQVPITLLGLSWGGKTALAFAMAANVHIDRLVLLYPGLRLRIRPNLWQRFQLTFARGHDIRNRSVRIPLDDATLFTDDPAAQDLIRRDPLALRTVTSGFLNSGRDLDRIVRDCSAQVLPPTLMLLAGRDRIVDIAETRTLVQSLPFEDLQISEYPEAHHTLEFDAKRDAVFSELIAWLQRPSLTCGRNER